MSWYYLIKKNAHYVIATHSNVKEFEEYGFHKVLGFSGNRDAVEFYTIKALWHDEVLHRKKKEARLWRIAMDMEEQFAKKLSVHKELLKQQAAERKKKRIFPREGMQIQGKNLKWLACEKCKRLYDNLRIENRHECSVEENKKIWAIDLVCGSGRGCNDDDKMRRWILARPRTSGKRNARKSTLIYTLMYGECTLYWQ